MHTGLIIVRVFLGLVEAIVALDRYAVMEINIFAKMVEYASK